LAIKTLYAFKHTALRQCKDSAKIKNLKIGGRVGKQAEVPDFVSLRLSRKISLGLLLRKSEKCEI